MIGFYQHTDIETKKRADAAGLTLAVPRSRMVRELPELVERELGLICRPGPSRPAERSGRIPWETLLSAPSAITPWDPAH